MGGTDPETGGWAEAYRKLRLCSGGGGFEAIPARPLTLDLQGVRRRLERANVPVVDARVMLIASMDVEVTVSRAGRILFKTAEAAVADRAFAAMLAFLGPFPPRAERAPPQ